MIPCDRCTDPLHCGSWNACLQPPRATNNFTRYLGELSTATINWLIARKFITIDAAGAYQSTPDGDLFFNDQHRYFLQRIRTHYRYFATAPLTVRPHLTPGVHASIRVNDQLRGWGFQSAEERDTFVHNHPNAKTVAYLGDPPTTEPNLQQIPIRTPEGAAIKEAAHRKAQQT